MRNDDYTVRSLTSEDLPHWGSRAGIEVIDWAGDALRLSDGGDGTVYAQISVFDVSLHVDGVRALRDYLTEVLTYAPNEGV